MVQFTSKGDRWHKARLVAKYRGLQYVDLTNHNIIGALSHYCPILYKVQDKRQWKKGLGNETVYEWFDPKIDLLRQADDLLVLCKRDSDFYDNIIE